MIRPSLKVVSLFSGTGFQEMGMKNCDLFDVESIASCDMDNYAVISYAAIHCGLTQEMVDTYNYPSREEMAEDLIKLNMGYDFKKQKKYDWMKKARGKDQFLNKVWLACKLSHNLGDISNVTEIPECNMMTYSFPCTNISIAGQQAGMTSETSSGLVYEVLRLLKVSHKPEYLLMENVDALLSKKFINQWKEIVEELSNIGYNTYYQVLNAKECGIPQNRKRVFGLSIRKDIDKGAFTFPIPFDNGKRLKDVLLPSEEVDEKYYIENDRSKKLIEDLIANGSLKWIEDELCDEEGNVLDDGVGIVLGGKSKEQIEAEEERWEYDTSEE